jgi:hypothetical protein
MAKSPQKLEKRDLTPSPRVNEPTQKSTVKEITPARMEMRERIIKHIEAKMMARIPQRSTYSRRTMRSTNRARLIHDKGTNTYLNYQQLLRHPKYKESWNKSAANEFGWLVQGLKDGRVKGTNTIKFM